MKIRDKALLLTAIIVYLTLFFSLNAAVFSVPDCVTVNILGNVTKVAGTGTIANLTSGSANTPHVSGGYIFTINLTGETQNARWKAFIGNASGVLTLDDSSGNTIYDWTLSTTTGEVYATRQSN